MGFQVYPAIDVRGGHVVRLRQGDYDRETRYGDDPFAVAAGYAQAGARWLHLVDLDGARSGRYTLGPLLERLSGELGLRVQTGGGLRDAEAAEQALKAGAARVVVGSLAVRKPQEVVALLLAYGREAVTIALDTRRDDDGTWRLPLHGWTEDSGIPLFEQLDLFAAVGMRHMLCTDIARDGMLSGPNLELYGALAAHARGLLVQASGGVRDIADVHATREVGCAGVVLGKALLNGRLHVREALAC